METIKQYPLTIVDKAGRRLSAVLEKTTSARGFDAAIVCHGLLSSKSGDKIKLASQWFARRGIPSLRFDFSGRGESEGGADDITLTAQLQNIGAAKDYMLSSFGARAFHVFGSSFGALTALAAFDKKNGLFTAEERASLILVALPHRTDFPAELYGAKALEKWKRDEFAAFEGYPLPYGFYEDLLKYRQVERTLAAIDAPALLIHGERDAYFPAEKIADMIGRTPNTAGRELVVVKGANHSLSSAAHRDAMIAAMNAFALKYRLPDANSEEK